MKFGVFKFLSRRLESFLYSAFSSSFFLSFFFFNVLISFDLFSSSRDPSNYGILVSLARNLFHVSKYVYRNILCPINILSFLQRPYFICSSPYCSVAVQFASMFDQFRKFDVSVCFIFILFSPALVCTASRSALRYYPLEL